MATRTIESPGVEWNEYDLSEVISYATGTNVVVMGFAHQGPTNQVVEITSKEELMQVFFGNIGPQNAAERYFYHSCIEILNTKGKLLCIRLPYGSGKGSGFSTGYVATAFFGQNVEMTSAEAYEWLKSEGVTEGYFKKVWEYYGGEAKQVVTKINPKPEAFVISPELYEEIKDGALEKWQAPEYDPLNYSYAGYSYKLIKKDGAKFDPDTTVAVADVRTAYIGQRAISDATSGGTYVEITPENINYVYLAKAEDENARYLRMADSEVPDESSADKQWLTDLTMGTGVLNGVSTTALVSGSEDDPTIVMIEARMVPYYDESTPGTILDVLKKSVFFTINKMETSIDEDYQGFYMTVADQDAFIRRGRLANSNIGLDVFKDMTAFNMDGVDFSESATSAYSEGAEYIVHKTDYDTVHVSGTYGKCFDALVEYGVHKEEAPNYIEKCVDENTNYWLTSAGNSLETPAESIRLDTNIVPDRLRNFRVNGRESLSQSCVDALPYVFDKPEFGNALEIGIHRVFTNLENDKLTYATLETYTGAINPDAMIGTKNGGREVYSLDRMTDNHSGYIELYQNPTYDVTRNVPILVRFGGKVVVDSSTGITTIDENNSTDGICVSLGGYRSCSEDNLNEYIGNLPAKIDNALLLIDSVLERDIDILIDGGLSTIWGYTYGIGEAMEKYAEDQTEVLDYNNTGYDAKEFDDTAYISKGMKKVLRTLGTDNFFNDRVACAIKDSIYSIFTQFDVFCRKTRKDCIFISDPPRFFFVHGEDTKASSKKDWVFSLDMYHPLKNLYESANSSYSCTYMNWVKKYDNTLADFIWLPMSPFAAEVMCETDAKYFMWWAPFGLNNGVLSTITDIAFRPNQGQCDYFYKTGFNPVCYFNDGGFVIWGQKTMQDKHSAFDRLNVRRLFLYLERKTVKALRWFIGEPNTTYTRQRVCDTLKPLYDYCVDNSGLYDYLLKCDEENNPPDIIDDNTLIVDIYLKPVRTIEFILANFYACKTGADFSEIVG